MKKYLNFIIILIYLIGYNTIAYSGEISKKNKIKILILSGNNNHAWQKTTPFLESILVESSIFDIEITNQPDTLKYKKLIEFDALVSNWNSFPDNDFVWSKEAEDGLLKYLEEGGGLVFFHASTSALYNWPEFKKISTGAWIENTWHGKPGPVEVKIENRKHPITKGLDDFSTFDELWINAEQNYAFQVLGSAVNDTILSSGLKKQPVIFVSKYGKGRIFHTLLGHDTRAMKNVGFQTLILRGTEWAATSKVRLSILNELHKK
jgi:type 1 glutamine amidotransferase